MGCSNNKEAAIHELNSMIAQMKAENNTLKEECGKFQDKDVRKKESQDLIRCQESFEGLIRALDSLNCENGEKTVFDKETFKEIVSFEKILNEKIRKIKEIIMKNEGLQEEEKNLDEEIQVTEKMISQLEHNFFPEEPSKNHDSSEKNQDSLNSQHDLLEELEKAEQVLKSLNEEISKSGIEGKINNSFQKILDLTDADVDEELLRVDHEIEELNAKMQSLKTRESELTKVQSFIHANPEPRPSLKDQILESQSRVQSLEEEKQKIQEEIHKMKKTSNFSGFDGKLEVLNEIIEKSRSTNKSDRIMSEVVVSDIEATLSKVKLLTKDYKNH
jgi:uncharacterized protein (UPF0335 family)